MAETLLTNIIQPEVIEASIGNSWLHEMKLMRLAPMIFNLDTREIPEGSLLSVVRNSFFQGTSGQAVPAGSAISSVGRTQTKENHPVIFRYGSLDEDDSVVKIMPATASADLNAQYANAGREAASQWLEDSVLACLEGTAAALLSNQAGSGATVTLENLAAGLAALKDMGTELNGGARFSPSNLYWKIYGLGLTAATSNTFGPAAQDEMVRRGQLVSEFMGGVYFGMDKLSAAPGTDEYFYFVGPSAISLRGSGAPSIEMERKTVLKQFGWIMNMRLHFAVGFRGVNWSAAGSDALSDVDLATSGNWALADTDSKYVKLARVLTDNA
jgi:hypothetical protein